MGSDGKRVAGVTSTKTFLGERIEAKSTMAETMSEVSTHDDVVFVAREAAAASDCCEVALPHLPRFPKKGRGTMVALGPEALC